MFLYELHRVVLHEGSSEHRWHSLVCVIVLPTDPMTDLTHCRLPRVRVCWYVYAVYHYAASRTWSAMIRLHNLTSLSLLPLVMLVLSHTSTVHSRIGSHERGLHLTCVTVRSEYHRHMCVLDQARGWFSVGLDTAMLLLPVSVVG